MMRRFYAFLEFVPSLLLLFMAFLTSLSAITRWLFSWPIPDEYEISRLLLSVVICWGIALAFRRDDHIQLDVFWDFLSDGWKRILTRIGSTLSMLLVGGFCLALGLKTLDTRLGGITTVDLGLSVWLFYASAWLGTLAAFLTLLRRVIFPEDPPVADPAASSEERTDGQY